jgi:PAS domain S-box-containing protein
MLPARVFVASDEGHRALHGEPPLPHRSPIEHLTRDLARVIETMNCGLLIRDPGGDITFVNETLLRWMGYTRNEMLGRPPEDFAPAELRDVIQEETKATQEGDLRVRLVVLQRKDSTTFPALIVPQRFFDEQGRLDGTFGVLVDLGAVQTAKPVRYLGGDALRESIDRIAVELHVLSLTADLPLPAPVLLAHPAFADLSPREQEVLMHLVAGERVAAIASELHISPHTVRNHLKSMYRKLSVSTQSELIQKVRSISRSNAPSGAPLGETGKSPID